MAYSLAAPLSLHDGHKLCHYIGMLVSGINTMNLTGSQPSPLPDRAEANLFAAAGSQFTRYVNIPAAQGVRCLWVFKEDGDPAPQLQSVTFALRGELANERTLAGLIDPKIAIAGEVGHSAGQELPVLIPLSLSLLLYTSFPTTSATWQPSDPGDLAQCDCGAIGTDKMSIKIESRW